MRALQDLFEAQWGKLMESLVEDGESYELDIIA